MIGNNHKGETLYGWDISSNYVPEYVWRGFGEEETHPKYTGDVKNGKPHGLGIFLHPNGYKYVGSWKDGRRNGKGTMTYTDGSKFVGEYKDEERWNGTSYDKDGKIRKKVVNGKWINQ